MSNNKPVIVLASDHAGYELKKAVTHFIEDEGLAADIIDVGAESTHSVDYPDFAAKAARAVLDGHADVGIVLCGTGLGVSITANRFKGIRAALCHNVELAELARTHNNANILALGARFTTHAQAFDIVRTFLSTDFSEEERHARRIKMLDELGLV